MQCSPARPVRLAADAPRRGRRGRARGSCRGAARPARCHRRREAQALEGLRASVLTSRSVKLSVRTRMDQDPARRPRLGHHGERKPPRAALEVTSRELRTSRSRDRGVRHWNRILLLYWDGQGISMRRISILLKAASSTLACSARSLGETRRLCSYLRRNSHAAHNTNAVPLIIMTPAHAIRPWRSRRTRAPNGVNPSRRALAKI